MKLEGIGRPIPFLLSTDPSSWSASLRIPHLRPHVPTSTGNSLVGKFSTLLLFAREGENEKVLSEHLSTEEQQIYEKNKKRRVVLSAHSSTSLGIDATRLSGAHRIQERQSHFPNRERKTRPYSRGRVCLPSDIRNTTVSDVPSCLHPC